MKWVVGLATVLFTASAFGEEWENILDHYTCDRVERITSDIIWAGMSAPDRETLELRVRGREEEAIEILESRGWNVDWFLIETIEVTFQWIEGGHSLFGLDKTLPRERKQECWDAIYRQRQGK